MMRYLTRAVPALIPTLIFIGISAAADRSFWAGVTRERGSDPPSRELLDETLRTYQKIFADFYASGGDPALIDRFPASREIRHEIFTDLGMLTRAGRVLVYDLASMSIESVDTNADGTVTARVFEEWNYVYQEIGSRKPVGPVRGMDVRIDYRMRRKADGWVVISWDPVEAPHA